MMKYSYSIEPWHKELCFSYTVTFINQNIRYDIETGWADSHQQAKDLINAAIDSHYNFFKDHPESETGIINK